jgi:pimeloyl-ACP methyl ester carboxylesterase
MFKKLASILAVVAIAVGVSSCSSTQTGASAATSSGLYSQTLSTTKCGEFLCGKINVPVDWAKPDGATFKLSFTYKPTKTGKYLFVNPGGPGASGVDFVQQNLTGIGTKALRDTYAIVGFDPRGTKGSGPVKCYNASDMDDFLYTDSGYTVGSPQDLAATRQSISDFVNACKANTGPQLGHLDTVSAARDLDLLRAVFKQDKLNYLGFSYGTFLGTTYATLFPTKVGRFVLDGAIDPTVSDEQQNLNQLRGFDLALHNFMTDCITKENDCPFTGTVDQGLARISNYLDWLQTHTLPSADGRRAGLAAITTGMYLTLYSNDYWTYLRQAFAQAFNNNEATIFLSLADFYNDRNQNGTYNSNEFEAFVAINCLDGRSNPDPAAEAAQNAKVIAASPTLGRFWQYGAEMCAHWPFPLAKAPADYKAKGAPTIMVVGTTADPATPYQQAVNLAHKILAKGFLVTFKGEGHTAYGRSNTCVSNAVDNFLIKGALPAKEPKC